MSVAQQEVAKASNELFEGGLWWVWGFRGSTVLRVLWGGLGRLGHWGVHVMVQVQGLSSVTFPVPFGRLFRRIHDAGLRGRGRSIRSGERQHAFDRPLNCCVL